jgi:Tfp pilus assembly protein FimT
MRQGARGERPAGETRPEVEGTSPPLPLAPRLVLRARSDGGFTLIEIIIVMFLFVAMLGIVVPRMNLEDDLASTGRKFIGALRTLQGIAMSTQKPVKLYLDLDQNKYWPMTFEGKEEKLLLDAAWATPRTLPESIRLADVSSGSTKRTSGRFDLTLYPNGRIDGAVMHLTDTNNNVLGIVVESATGAIRTSDERIEPQRAAPIPDRVKQLLIPTATVASGSSSGPFKP